MHMLMDISTFPILPFLISLLFIYIIFRKSKKSSLLVYKLPPNPPRLPIIGNLHQLGHLPHLSLWELSRKYGPVMSMRFGQKPTLVISSVAMAKQVLGTYDVNFCTRSSSVGTRKLSYNYSDLAFTPHGDHWREMRKVFVTELVGHKRVQLFDRAREREVDSLIRALSSVPPDTAVNLDEKLFDLVNGVVCSVAIGKSYKGRQFEGRNLKELVVEAMEMLSACSFGDFFPSFGWLIDDITGWNARLDKCFHDLDGYIQMALDEHIASSSQAKNGNPQDFLDTLVELSKDETRPFKITKESIKGIVMNSFLGGVDTPFVTLVWAMSEIFKDERVMHKLQTEIRTCIGDKRKIEQEDLARMPYLKMVVKETLRLHPAAPFLIPHESVHHCKIDGYDVLPKTQVMINAWAIGRDSETWRNPNEFFPERFEEMNVNFLGTSFEMVPFGAGRRTCPGVNVAVPMVESTIANLLYWFDWKAPNGMKREDISMEEEGRIVVRKKSPLFLVPINKFECQN